MTLPINSNFLNKRKIECDEKKFIGIKTSCELPARVVLNLGKN